MSLLFPRIRSFIYGITLPFEAGRVIFSRPKLIFWSILPILITLGLYGLLIASLQARADFRALFR